MLEYFFHEIVENCEAHCIEYYGALDIVNFMYMYLDIYCNKCCIIRIYIYMMQIMCCRTSFI